MSQKYYDRLTQGTGISHKQFSCEYGLKLLKKMGWKEGSGLGKNSQGIKECVQFKKRDETEGLGYENKTKEFRWNDNWWDHAFNNAISKLSVKTSNKNQPQQKDLKIKSLNKTKKIQKVKKMIKVK